MEANNIQLFSYENKEVRTFEKDGLVWFVAADIADITGHANINDSIYKILDKDEIDTLESVDTIGRKRNYLAINECGFYRLIFHSTLPQAKAFTKFVTSVILPTIRKTGGYNVNTKQLQEIATDKQEIETLTATKNRINKRLRFLKMRVEENETAIFSPYRANKTVLQPEIEAIQYSLF